MNQAVTLSRRNVLCSGLLLAASGAALAQASEGTPAEMPASNPPPGGLGTAPSANTVGAQLTKQRNALGLAARVLAAGVFESNRDAYEVLDNDILPFSVFARQLPGAEVSIDQARRELSVSMVGANGALLKRTARYTPGFGCAVLPDDGANGLQTHLPEPEMIAAADTQPWAALRRSQINPQISAALDLAFAPTLAGVPGKASRLDTRAVIVVHRGKIIGERYAPGFGPQSRLISWSMGKGVAASLLGVYAKQYGLDLDAPAPVAAWSERADDPRRQIRTIDILQMASGLDFGIAMNPQEAFSDSDLHTQPYCAAIDSEKLVLSRPLKHQPGTFFQYKNCDPLLVMSIIKQGLGKAGEDFHRWPRQHLFDVLGASSLTMHTDMVGNFIPSGMMFATARDYARIGQLYAQRGVWRGQALWPSAWYERLVQPSPSFAGYGGLVWTNAMGLFPGVPRDAFFLSGYFGQRTIVVPSHDLVVVRLGMTLAATSDGATADGAPAPFPAHLAQVLQTIISALPSQGA